MNGESYFKQFHFTYLHHQFCSYSSAYIYYPVESNNIQVSQYSSVEIVNHKLKDISSIQAWLVTSSGTSMRHTVARKR